MHYEINVSRHGRHYFATHIRSLRDSKRAKEVFEDFLSRFPEEEGFELRCTYYQQSGTVVARSRSATSSADKDHGWIDN